MAADQTLVSGAYKAAKAGFDKNNLGGLDQVTQALRDRQVAKETEVKAQEAALTKEREIAGKEISRQFVEMGPMLKSLGQESFTQAQNEVEALRQQMFEAIDAKDQKKIAELNIQLNEIKSRHSSNAESLTTFTDQWENDLVSTAGTKPEHMEIMKNFVDNPSKKEVYEGDPPKLHYQWDKLIDGEKVPELDNNNQPVIGDDGEIVYEKETVSLERLNDMIVPSDNENGVRVMDYIEAQKKIAAEGGKGPDNAALKKEMRSIVPTDKKILRDWTYGNPAGADGLNVREYLMDHPLLNNQYKALGIEDINDPIGIGPEDFVDGQDKEEMIRMIMDVDNPEITHEIISDIYASIASHNIRGQEEGKKDYWKGSQELIGATNQEEAFARNQGGKLELLQSLKTPEGLASIKSLNKTQIKTKFKLTDEDLKGLVDETGQLVNIDSFIAAPTTRTNKTAEDYLNE